MSEPGEVATLTGGMLLAAGRQAGSEIARILSRSSQMSLNTDNMLANIPD